MAVIAFLAPIPPEKRAQWDAFRAEITGPRHSEFNASRRSHGVHERTFLQETPMGDFVMVTLDGENPLEGLLGIAREDSDFARWFHDQVQEIHGFDLRQPPENPPILVIDSETPA